MAESQTTPTKEETEMLTNISAAIISNQIAYVNNHNIQLTPYFKQRLKRHLKIVNEELEKAERNEFDMFFDMKEESTEAVFNAQFKMIEEITSLGLFHYENITEIIKAYKKDPKSIQGIVNKINRK